MSIRRRTGSAITRRLYMLVELGRRDGFECSYCHVPLVPPGREAVYCDITPEGWVPIEPWALPGIDHEIPVAKGGSDQMDNLVLACWPCNYEKRTRHHVDWIASASPAFFARLHRSAIPRNDEVVHRRIRQERAGQ